MIEALVADIRANAQFHADLHGLLGKRMGQVLARDSGRAEPEGRALDRLIQSAGLFSLSVDPKARHDAFAIATAAFELYGGALGGLADNLTLVLSRLGHFPALDFRAEFRDRPSRLPTPVLLEATGRRIQNTIAMAGGELSLTDYQRLIWNDLKSDRSVIASAPTSAGKSFTFQMHLVDQLSRGRVRTAAFIVPTRALISQVSAQLSERLSGLPDLGVRVLTIPVAPADTARPSIFVMTQERVQVLLGDPAFHFDIAVIDEAHLVGDGDRGVILQSVIEDLLARNPATQLLFTLPQVHNPDALARIFRVAAPQVRKTGDSPVGQNIILLDVRDSMPDQVRAQLWDKELASESLNFDLPVSLVDPDQKLVYLAWFFGRGSQSIVYGDTQARCETLAWLLKDLVEHEDESPLAEQRRELSRFIQDHVHPDFLLAQTVLAGVGFHYGHIPSLVRRAIEVAFDERILDFIVCTNTLLQGVNLPARNIFMRCPEKGQEPLEAVDFWNLAGRAGRLGKEFEGNVFMIDYADWEKQPLGAGPEGHVQSALQEQVIHHSDALLAYIGNASIESGKDKLLENIFSRLFKDFRLGKLEDTLDYIDAPEDVRSGILAGIEEAARTIQVPDTTLGENPTISPHRQQRLYAKLIRDVPKKGVDYYMPPHPAGEWKKVQSKLINVYRRLQVELDGQPRGDAYKRWATLSLQWMRGQGLPDLIQYAIDQDERRVTVGQAAGRRLRSRSRASIIRDILKDVERELRFKFVKQMGCYNSVLREVLLQIGEHRAAAHIPAIPLFLEVGASSETMLSLIDLGLSRISARLLQQRAANYSMDRETALAWLRRQDFRAIDLPIIVQQEIAPLLT
ncbi:MAG: hypothetical protein C0491_07105 [Novosphingobium sp.]|nr:hypothetical protein [Novosphingobium sp.]